MYTHMHTMLMIQYVVSIATFQTVDLGWIHGQRTELCCHSVAVITSYTSA